MLESQARFVEPRRSVGVPSGDAGESERAVNFRFSVTWSSLFVPLEPAVPGALVPTKDRVRTVDTSARTVTVTDEPPPADQPKAASGSGAQWEMVVPKMVRASSTLVPRPLPVTPRSEQSVPNLYTASSGWFLARARDASLGVRLLLGGVAIAGIAIPIWMYSSSQRSHAVVEANMGGGGWMREPSAPMGAKLARQLVLYRPSLGATDCRLEFAWTVNSQGVAWIFRAKDKNNYYAMRIKILRPGPSPTISVEHFTVYQGTEGAHVEKMLILSKNDPALRIRLDVTGPIFTLYVQGSAADYWTDTRLTAGGLGFFEEGGQPADVQSVRMSFSQAAKSEPEPRPGWEPAPTSGGV